MKKERYITLILTSEAAVLLLISVSAYNFCLTTSLHMSVLPVIIVVCFTVIQIFCHVCFLRFGKFSSASKQMDDSSCSTEVNSNMKPNSHVNSSQLVQERLNLFQNEYQYEQEQYRQQKEKADMEKLEAILKYTRDIFKKLEMEEAEVYQICESVRYFVTNNQTLSMTELRIRKRTHITQIALKNFAWNIAFQYGIGGELTAEFVLVTFNEWFANSTLDTIRKNLRTTSGNHKIEIDEHII